MLSESFRRPNALAAMALFPNRDAARRKLFPRPPKSSGEPDQDGPVMRFGPSMDYTTAGSYIDPACFKFARTRKSQQNNAIGSRHGSNAALDRAFQRTENYRSVLGRS